MKILAFSDVHRDLKRCEALVESAAGADIVIGAGDFATARRGLEETIAALSPALRPNATVLAVSSASSAWKSPPVSAGVALRRFASVA